MEAYAYIRVSDYKQVKDGVSLEVQRAKAEAWALANDCEMGGVLVDAGIPGKSCNNRDGLKAALEEVKACKGVLIVYSLSRLSRSTRDTLAIADQLDKAGADLVSLSEKIDTTSAAGKMVFRMMAVLNEFERDQVSERTRGAMAHLRSQGRRISHRIPFGYDLGQDGKTLVENAAEKKAIALMLKLRASGTTLREICADLDRRDIKTKTGKPWAAGTVHGILKKAV